MEVQSEFSPSSVFQNISTTADPLNVTSTTDFFNGILPEIIFVRYLFRVINTVISRCVEIIGNGEDLFIVEQFSSFLMFCLHILQSGRELIKSC